MPDQSLLWPAAPNWRESVNELHEWRTEIITSRSGREQRRALRQSPRVSFEYTGLLTGDRYQTWSRAMSYRQADAFQAAHPAESVMLTTPLASPATTFNVDSVPPWLTDGALCVLSRGQAIELVQVDTIVALLVTLTDSTAASFVAGSRLHPAVTCRAADVISSKQQTNTVAEVSVRLNVEPGFNVTMDPGAVGTVLNGREVFLRRPNWADQPQIDFEAYVERLDFGFGRAVYSTPRDYRTNATRATYVARSPAEAREVTQFAARMRGQQGEFYMPNLTADLPAVALTGGASTMTLPGANWHLMHGSDTVRRAVAVTLADGSVLLNRISSWANVAGNSQATMVSAWPVTVAPSGIRSISWCPVCRLASDSITVEWLTRTVAQYVLPIRTLEDLGGV
jgi:hypothetical protein